MKKIILLLLFSSLSIALFAQSRESFYHLESFNKSFEVKVSNADGDYFEFEICCPSFDGRETGLILRKPDVPSFVERLNEMKNKFSEWSKTAIENEVLNFQKRMDIDFNPIKVFFIYGDDYHYAYGVKLYTLFFVNEKGTPMISILTGNIVAQDNMFMKSKGIALVFLSNQEIDNFIRTLNTDDIVKTSKPKEELDKLFK